MSYKAGAKAIKRMALEQNPYAFYQAKLSEPLFKGDEIAAFQFVNQFFQQFHALPSVSLLEEKFPDFKELDVPEPGKYYVNELTNRFGYDSLSRGMKDASEILKTDKTAVNAAADKLRGAVGQLLLQQKRQSILNVGKDGPDLLLQNYHGQLGGDVKPMYFGWEYLDSQGGAVPGDLVSWVGRPAQGKTYFMLSTAIYDWTTTSDSDLFVSMEMSALQICKRIGAMYTHTPIKQLNVGGFSSHTFDVFCAGLDKMSEEKGNFYVVDGNLATAGDEIFDLAAVLGCKKIWIDGGYLVRHANKKLNRYERVAENAELFKKRTGDEGLITSVSWQFARDAVKKVKGGQGPAKVKPGLEDIGYSDVIGQASSLVFGLMQEDSVETILCRIVDVLKGRDGQIGQWKVNWDFDTMDFTQHFESKQEAADEDLEHV